MLCSSAWEEPEINYDYSLLFFLSKVLCVIGFVRCLHARPLRHHKAATIPALTRSDGTCSSLYKGVKSRYLAILCRGRVRTRTMWLFALFILIAYLVYRVYLRATQASRIREYFYARHVWVIGASRGIGGALAHRLASLNAKVSVSSRSVRSQLDLVDGLKANVVPLDISKGCEAIQSAWDTVRTRAPVDVVIACAGINNGGKKFVNLRAYEIDRVLDTNIRGVAHIFHTVLRDMQRGRLCAVSSLTAYRGLPGASIYGASKAALTNLCQSLNVELWSQPVSVIAVHPGFVNTPAIRDLDHPKPFLMSEERAADLVLDAIVSDTRHYGFPWVMEHIVMRFANMVPSPLYDWILYATS